MPRRLLAITFLMLASPAFADDKPAAKLRSPVGTVLRATGDNGWLAPMLYDGTAPERELLTLPERTGNLDIAEGDMRLVLAGNLPDFSRTPVLESVVTLHSPPAGLDLDFTLHRGRVLIENRKESGSVKVRARIQGKNLDFDLVNKSPSWRWSFLATGPSAHRFRRRRRPIKSRSAS